MLFKLISLFHNIINIYNTIHNVKFNESLQNIKELPQKTLIYSGHEYTDTNINFAKSVVDVDTKYIQSLKDKINFKQTLIIFYLFHYLFNHSNFFLHIYKILLID